MHFTQFSDIGLRLLMYLAKEQRDIPPITVSEVATQFSIPKNHLVKVTGVLVKQGWITSLRGRNGGIRLAVAPASLSLGKVLRVLEGEVIVACETMQCRLLNGCSLRLALGSAINAFFDTMDEFTLEDITQGKTGQDLSAMHASIVSFYNK